MKEFDDLISDAQLEEMMSEVVGEDPTVQVQNIFIPLQNTKSNETKAHKTKEKAKLPSKAVIGRIKTKRTQQLIAAHRTRSVIKADRIEASGMAVHDIYKNAKLGDDAEGNFNVFRVESMLDDISIVELDENGKEAAVALALKTHDVELDSIFEDARNHQFALEAHDQRFRDELASVTLHLSDENQRLQSEIERYANPRIERIEKNIERLDIFQREYDDWGKVKETEYGRLEKILSRWNQENAHSETQESTEQKIKKRETKPLGMLASVSQAEYEFEKEKFEASPIESFVASDVFEDFEIPSSVISESLKMEIQKVDHTHITEKSTSGWEDWMYRFWVFFSVLLWFIGGLTFAVVVESMQPVAALGLTFGVPVGFALFMGLISQGHGRWFGYLAFLGYCGFAVAILAHLDIDHLAKLLTETPVWLSEPSIFEGKQLVLPDLLVSGLNAGLNRYGELLYQIGLASR